MRLPHIIMNNNINNIKKIHLQSSSEIRIKIKFVGKYLIEYIKSEKFQDFEFSIKK